VCGERSIEGKVDIDGLGKTLSARFQERHRQFRQSVLVGESALPPESPWNSITFSRAFPVWIARGGTYMSSEIEPTPKPAEPHLQLHCNIDGAAFSAAGPRSEVLRLYDEWKDLAGLRPAKKPSFNLPQMSFTK
jgi:hypothetical protein